MPGAKDDLLSALDAAPDAPPPAASEAGEPHILGTDKADLLSQLDEAPDQPSMQNPTSGMRAAAIAAQDLTPDHAAQAAAIATRAGVNPQSVVGSVKQIQAAGEFDVAHFDDIAARHPELAQWLTEPVHAAIARDNLVGLRQLSTQVQALTDPSESLPLLGAFKQGVIRTGAQTTKTLLAGPAWLQDEARKLFGITSAPAPYSPLGMVYEAVDTPAALDRVRQTYAPSAMRDFVSQMAGMAVDPTTTLLAPAEGARLAVAGSQVIDAALTAKTAIKGAALIQGEIAGGQALARGTEEKQRNPSEAAGALATTVNMAVQASLGYFLGKAGQELPILRSMGATPFTANPLKELAGDVVRNASVGGALAVTGGTAESLLTQGRVATPGEQLEMYLSGAIPGGLLAAGNIHEAIISHYHVQTIRNAEGIQFGNKLADAMKAAKDSVAAQHSPEEVGKLIDAISQRGIKNTYLQAEEWQDHFVKLGLDPIAEAEKAGLKDEYIRARSLNGDMQIPVRAAIGMGIDATDPAALAAKFRQAPNAPNAIESVKFFQEGLSELATQQALTLASEQIKASGEAIDTKGTALYERLKAEGEAAGRTSKEAGDFAELTRRFATRMVDLFNVERAKIPGQKPFTVEDFAAHFPLEIRKATPEILAESVKAGHLERVLNELRAPVKTGEAPLSEGHIAIRSALEKMGLHPLEHTNEHILAEMTKLADEHAKLAKAGEVSPEDRPIRLEQGLRLDAPRNDSLMLEDLRKQWKKAHGDRSPDESSVEWRRLVQKGRRADAERGLSFAQGARGALTTDALRSVIHLFQGANRSTLFHEGGHYFLETMGKLASRPDAPESLKADFQKVMEWSGYGTHENMLETQRQLGELQKTIGDREPTPAEKAKLKELSAPHETFARGFEAYLMTGQAPAVGLRRAFARIKAWMKSVYQDVKSLGVQMNPEITAVFDRMIASDREIAAARLRVADELAFTDEASSGMTPEKFAEYQRLAAEADRLESEELEQTLMGVERKALSDAYKADHIAEREAVSTEVGLRPEYQAMSALQDGKTPDGRDLETPIKILKSDIERMLTPAEIAQLPGRGRGKNKGREIYTPDKEKGVLADEAAPLFGYPSGHELLQALINAPDRETLIDIQTNERMKAKYPDPMENQQLMDQEADRALHATDARVRLLDMERKALAALSRAEAAGKTDKAVEAEHRTMQGKLDSLKAKIAANKATAQEEKDAEAIIASLNKTVSRAALEEVRDQRQAMAVAAREMIRQTKLSGFDPERFTAAERKSAIKFKELMGKKDYTGALEAKRAQMMNAELAKAAYAAEEQASKDQSHLLKLAQSGAYRQTIAKAGGWEWTVSYPDGTTQVFNAEVNGVSAQEQARTEAINRNGTYDRTSGYLDQIDSLLERFDLKTRSPKELRRRESLKAFLEKTEYFTLPDGEKMANGFLANIPEHLITAAQKINVKDMTVNDLHDLRTAVESLESMAKLKNKLLASTRHTDLMEMVAELNGILQEHSKGEVAQKVGRGLADAPLNALGNFRDSMRQVTMLVYEMDGFKEGGPMWDAVLRPQIEASNREMTIIDGLGEKISEALKVWGKNKPLDPFSLNMRSKIEGVPEPMNHWARIMTLMHYGNPEGRQRIMDGYHWNEAQIKAIINGLDAKDIQFANAMVDILSLHWSDVKAMEEKLNGIAPAKVEAIPVQLDAGTYKGGYMRLYYDGQSARAIENMASDDVLGGMQGRGLRAMTARGYTKERAATLSGLRPNLDPISWSRALNEMAHDLSHREMVLDQGRLLANKDFANQMIKYWGQGIFKQFVNQLKGIAGGSQAAQSSMGKTLEYLRMGVNYANRGFSAKKAIEQIAGLPLIVARIPTKYVVSSFLQNFSGPLCIDRTSNWIHNQSATMRDRAKTFDKNIMDRMAGISMRGPARKFMDAAGYYMWTKMFQYMDNVTWKAAYDQHMDASSGDHAKAVLIADQVMESLMGSGKQKDIPEIMRGGPLGQVFTGSMSWGVANWNQIVQALNQTHYGWQRRADGGASHMAKGLGSLAVLTILGPMLYDWLRDELRGADMKDWKNPKGLAMEALIKAPVVSTMSSIPMLRDMTSAAVEGRHFDGMAGLRSMTIIADAASAFHAKHYTEATAKAIGAAAGTFLHLPSAFLFQAYDAAKETEKSSADLSQAVWTLMNGKPKKH